MTDTKSMAEAISSLNDEMFDLQAIIMGAVGIIEEEGALGSAVELCPREA